MVIAGAKLSENLPPLVFGSATFNYQFNQDPFALGPTTIVQRAFAHGIRAFDTSPYYGPAEEILGTALKSDLVQRNYPRDQYFILTKAGRIAEDSFDYSPDWIQYSVERSCKRLGTSYLDLVFCHDVEFVAPDEVLTAVKELRKIRNEQGKIKYVGISGYPIPVLATLAERILQETGEPLDAVLSYANFTLQNTQLLTKGLPRLISAGVDVVLNASPLGMGLLRRQGPPIGAMGNWHPAPDGLRNSIRAASDWTDSQGERLEVISVRFALENWLREGTKVGTQGSPLSFVDSYQSKNFVEEKLGVTVMGVSSIEELDEIMRVWRSVLDGLMDDLPQEIGSITPSDAVSDHEWSLKRRQRIRELAKSIRELIGGWADYTWPSPGAGFVNVRHRTPVAGDSIASKLSGVARAMMTPPSEMADEEL